MPRIVYVFLHFEICLEDVVPSFERKYSSFMMCNLGRWGHDLGLRLFNEKMKRCDELGLGLVLENILPCSSRQG